jgi:hypothetical protein
MSDTLKDQLTIRLDPATRERLETAAEQDRRPVSNLARIVLIDWLEQSQRSRHREVA